MKTLLYQGEVAIPYFLKKASNPSDALVVSFPGAGGSENDNPNYIFSISQFNVNALYIMPHGEGSEIISKRPFICVNRDFKIERSMVALINKIKEETGSRRIIAVGSSAGGVHAWYYGLKYNWDVIAGAPRYILKSSEDVRYMAGSNRLIDRDWVNTIFYDAVKLAKERGFDKSFFVSWGEGEYNWLSSNHGQRFVKDLEEAGVTFTYKLYPYSSHHTVHYQFPHILIERLALILGLATDDATQSSRTESVALLYDEIRQNLHGLAPLVDEVDGPGSVSELTEPMQYASNDEAIALRNYVYATNGYFWLPGWKEPFNAGEAQAYWEKMPPDAMVTAMNFTFQQTILNHYKYSKNVAALVWVAGNVKQFFESIISFASIHGNYSELSRLVMRLHFFIDFYNEILKLRDTSNAVSSDDINDSQRVLPQILAETKRFLFKSQHALPTNHSNQLNVISLLLHVARFFGRDEKWLQSASHVVWENFGKLINYYFDQHGVCIVGQVQLQQSITLKIQGILDFAVKNGFKETKGFKSIQRKFKKIKEVASFWLLPNGARPAIGHSSGMPTIGLTRKIGSLIKPESDIAVLSNDTSLITIGSGNSRHSTIRHCDLLSFTWFYEGQWLFLDSGGGNGALSEFAQSSVAHSAFLFNDKDYVTPHYFDFTSIAHVDEHEDYVLLELEHTLFSDVILKRKFVWIKPNVIVLLDSGVAKESNKFTQNFILHTATLRQTAKNEPWTCFFAQYGEVELKIKQFYDDFELNEYTGTTNAQASQNTMRGSIIQNFGKLTNGLNLAFNKNGSIAQFLTALEAHSGRKNEVSVKKLSVNNNSLAVILDDGSEKTIPFAVKQEEVDLAMLLEE
jgi:hypothetical protein